MGKFTIGFLLLFINVIQAQDLNQVLIYFENTDLVKYQYHVLEGNKYFMNGPCIAFYKDSSINASGWYSMNKKDSIWHYYNKVGQLMAKGEYQDDLKEGKWIYYRENGKIESSGSYKKGKEQGSWLYYNEHEVLICKGEYDQGEEVENSFVYYNVSGEIIETLEIVNDTNFVPTCRILDEYDRLAYERNVTRYPENHIPQKQYEIKTPEVYFSLGGEALFHYYFFNLDIPEEVSRFSETGRAQVVFFVKPNGRLEIVKIHGSFSKSFDESVKKMLLSMPNWIPATKAGNPIKTVYFLPFSFYCYR